MRQTHTYWIIGRLYIVLLALAALAGFALRGTVSGSALPLPYAPATTGYDISWPNCDVMPPTDNAWGIVGVTGGRVFSENPCLKAESRWFRTTTLYINTGYAGIERAARFADTPRRCATSDEQCFAYNYGYQAGIYAAERAFAQGLYARMWWLDVETENSWSDDTEINRQSLRGTVDAIRHKTVGATIGYYSYPGQWDRITGDWRPGGPAWAATGTADRQAAIDACKEPGFTSGPVLLTQYVLDLDHNYACPAVRDAPESVP
jgi:hypothetical protein